MVPGRVGAERPAALSAVHILVVEDEAVLREGLVDLLRAAGHEVEATDRGAEALSRAVSPEIGLVVLDRMLPDLDGVEVCARLRELRPSLPILMLTARGAEEDKILGLRSGADDYVTKPFATGELVARVEALGRRARISGEGPDTVTADGCVLDLGRCLARRRDEERSLTSREAAILRLLHRHRNRAVRRAELLEHVWGLRGDTRTRTVDMAMANLRQKIEEDPAAPRIVVTVKGVGYAWGAD